LLGEVRGVWEEWRVIPERFLDAGDQVVVIETVHARGRASGVELADRTAAMWTLRRGRVARD
jgi:ketosteroid isomerase-like protein